MARLCEYGHQLGSMTAQEVFTVAKEHLLSQGERSSRSGVCKYNGGDVCCAAAPFVLTYNPEMEGNGWLRLVKQGVVDEKHCYLIALLQKIHDCVPTDKWSMGLDILEKVIDFPATDLATLNVGSTYNPSKLLLDSGLLRKEVTLREGTSTRYAFTLFDLMEST